MEKLENCPEYEWGSGRNPDVEEDAKASDLDMLMRRILKLKPGEMFCMFWQRDDIKMRGRCVRMAANAANSGLKVSCAWTDDDTVVFFCRNFCEYADEHVQYNFGSRPGILPADIDPPFVYDAQPLGRARGEIRTLLEALEIGDEQLFTVPWDKRPGAYERNLRVQAGRIAKERGVRMKVHRAAERLYSVTANPAEEF